MHGGTQAEHYAMLACTQQGGDKGIKHAEDASPMNSERSQSASIIVSLHSAMGGSGAQLSKRG